MPCFMYVKTSQSNSLLHLQKAKTTANHLLLPDEVQLCLTKYWKYTFNPHLIRQVSLALLLCLSLSIKLPQNNYTTVGPRYLMLSLSALPWVVDFLLL